jgi:hypothetical protein
MNYELRIKISGKVVKGMGYGRKLGFPTANLERRQWRKIKVKPKLGVWAGTAKFQVSSLKSQVYKAGIAERRKDEPEKHKQIDFKNDLKKYGLTPEDYRNMFESQKGKCACCGTDASEFRRGLHVDHDHSTGQVRALLCTKCNPGIGYFDDSTERLEMAIKYLNKFKK